MDLVSKPVGIRFLLFYLRQTSQPQKQEGWDKSSLDLSWYLPSVLTASPAPASLAAHAPWLTIKCYSSLCFGTTPRQGVAWIWKGFSLKSLFHGWSVSRPHGRKCFLLRRQVPASGWTNWRLMGCWVGERRMSIKIPCLTVTISRVVLDSRGQKRKSLENLGSWRKHNTSKGSYVHKDKRTKYQAVSQFVFKSHRTLLRGDSITYP